MKNRKLIMLLAICAFTVGMGKLAAPDTARASQVHVGVGIGVAVPVHHPRRRRRRRHYKRAVVIAPRLDIRAHAH